MSQIQSSDMIIIGAGAAGLACAWALSDKGLKISVIDRLEPGRGAVWASAGMLAAGFETCLERSHDNPQSDAFAALCQASLQTWPSWVDAIEKSSQISVKYNTSGSLVPLCDTGQICMETVLSRAETAHIRARLLKQDTLTRMEPGLAPAKQGLFFPDDGQIDNRALVQAWLAGLKQRDVTFIFDEVIGFNRQAGLIAGVVLKSGEVLNAQTTVLTTGADQILSAQIGLDIQPVKGQMVGFPIDAISPPSHVIRARDVYLVAKPDRLIVGATSEPGVSSLDTDEALIADLISKANRIWPALKGLSPSHTWAGLRPFLPQGLPMVGTVEPGLVTALGGYRNGVLLAPVMAEAVSALVQGHDVKACIKPFLYKSQLVTKSGEGLTKRYSA